jgi:hypothetical protein
MTAEEQELLAMYIGQQGTGTSTAYRTAGEQELQYRTTEERDLLQDRRKTGSKRPPGDHSSTMI